ncbi:MAG: hypothetical protein J5911_04225 [Clostridia bacterium]|nr:hypothetical protein [Clostridia bacterium]
MKSIIVKIITFFKSKSFKSNVIVSITLIALFVGIGLWIHYGFQENVTSAILSASFGYVLANVALFVLKVFARVFEDRLKVFTSTKDMAKIYKNIPLKTVKLNGTECEICYKEILVNDGCRCHVQDDPDKSFELDGFIEQNYLTLFSAHASSTIENSDTIRLDDVEKIDDGEYVFHLSRSTYYHSLVTNRAVDYPLSKDLTIRKYFEYGPDIHPLNQSKLSNHVGINALVFFEENGKKFVLFPQRKGDSTISKQAITSAIATKLNFPDDKGPITDSYLFGDCTCINQELSKRVGINVKELNKSLPNDKKISVTTIFLGVGQNIYEGGKPQMYYAVRLNNFMMEYLPKKHKTNTNSKLDNDKYLLCADWNTLSFNRTGEKMVFSIYKHAGNKTKKSKARKNFERSLLCNIWHYLEYQKARNS